MESVLGEELWEVQREIMDSVVKNRETAVKSCHGSGKTYSAGALVVAWLLCNPNNYVVTTAPTHRQVKEVLWGRIRAVARKSGFFDPGMIQETKLKCDDEWFAIGFATNTPDNFQGLHSERLLIVVDEASGISDEIYEAMDGLNPYRTLLLGNPLRTSGRFYRAFKDPNVNKITISAFDTPNLKAGKVVIPGLIDAVQVKSYADKYGIESATYKIRVLGEFPSGEDNSLVSVDDIAAAQNRTQPVEERGLEKIMGVDPARFGQDRTAIVIRQGSTVLKKELLTQNDGLQVAAQVMRLARENNVQPVNIHVDVIGIGASVFDQLKAQGWRVNAVTVSNKSSDPNKYANLRVELGFKLKEWLKTGVLPPDDDDFYEFVNVHYDFTPTGQYKLESKEDIKRRGLPSPDIFDALALTFSGGYRFIQTKPTYPKNTEYFPGFGF